MFSFLAIQSQYGTYINAIRVSDQQIHNGDIISLVDRGNIPDPNCHDYDFLSFILRRIEFNESMSQSDDEASQVIVSSNSSGEILVSTNTISIDLTKDSDDDEDDSDDEGDSDDEDEDDFKAKFKGDFKDRFAEDYEVGEPSSKHLDSDQESKPTTKPSSNPKRPKDPVDKVNRLFICVVSSAVVMAAVLKFSLLVLLYKNFLSYFRFWSIDCSVIRFFFLNFHYTF